MAVLGVRRPVRVLSGTMAMLTVAEGTTHEPPISKAKETMF